MGLFSWTVGLPLAPVRGLIGIGRVIQRQVDAEMLDPAAIRHRLEALDEAQRRGEISPEEAAHQQGALTRAVVRRPGSPPRRRGGEKPEESER